MRGATSTVIRRRPSGWRSDALLDLIRVGWGRENPAFRQVFTSLFIPDGSLEQLRWFNDLQRASTSPENAARLFAEFGTIDVRELAPRVTCPTLVLHAREDARVPYVRLGLLPVVTGTMWPWAALAFLGAIHGLNPGMGWLFAVARGLQERDRRAVWGALLPLAAGHALAIAAAIAVAAVLGLALPADGLRWMVAATLLVFGLLRLRRHRHPRGMGMRVGSGDLTLWSFLMASAHGAGLVALPFVLTATATTAAVTSHGAHGRPRRTARPRRTPWPWRACLTGRQPGSSPRRPTPAGISWCWC